MSVAIAVQPLHCRLSAALDSATEAKLSTRMVDAIDFRLIVLCGTVPQSAVGEFHDSICNRTLLLKLASTVLWTQAIVHKQHSFLHVAVHSQLYH